MGLKFLFSHLDKQQSKQVMYLIELKNVDIFNRKFSVVVSAHYIAQKQ